MQINTNQGKTEVMVVPHDGANAAPTLPTGGAWTINNAAVGVVTAYDYLGYPI